jgi:lysophospholipase L1-like esterase
MIPLDFDTGKPVSVRCTLSGYAGLGIYDQGGNTLDVITGVNAADYGLVSGQGMKTYTITLPEGAKYVRMSASTSTPDGSPAYATPSDFVLMGEKTSGLSDKIAALENEINSNVTDIASKKVLVIGDSISADYYGDYPKWVTHLIDIGFFNSSNTVNDSVHATGFVSRYNNEANDFISRLAAVTNPEVYDMVIVFGGINDYIKDIPMGESGGDKLTSFKPAVDDFFAMLTERFVGARIAVLSPLRTKNYNIANAAGHKQTDYADYIKTVAQTYALPVLDLMNCSGFHPEHETFRQRWTFKNWTGGDGTIGDGTHPIEEYERKYLAPMIRHFLQGLL